MTDLSSSGTGRAGGTAHSNGRGLTGLLLVSAPVALLGWLIIYPIFNAIARTLFAPTQTGTAFSLDTYGRFFSDGYALANLWLTLWVTAVCAALLLAICLPLALYLRFAKSRVAGVVQGLALFPMFVPSVILAYALIRTIGPNGGVDLVLNALGLPKINSPYLTPWGPIIGLVWDNIPLTTLMLVAGLGAVSDNAVEAARDAGARPIALLRHIILPQIGNAMLVVLSFTVLSIFSAFTLPYVLGPASPEMMGPFMQRTFSQVMDPRMAVTQAVITFAICAVFGAFYVRSIAKNREARR
ncbi:ABC transporter permease [Alloyangia pacifica]|uniref:ABC-type spermidine/putrescine transport system, permease component I n=1 Tax=Alloyangia pacifica TaxID=311180 RepID=A0A1I6UPB0_9RHOB|nr:ABC transporter permease subunit [Alloyangia pacifica]SDH77317.1 ABC-type spermidine/putrescine transport system, permease component I [Alloyangia pacifica]SFT03306.1 ABC-type spermidine/putrescine transport system, permease component I [Alloyangia pacifica]